MKMGNDNNWSCRRSLQILPHIKENDQPLEITWICSVPIEEEIELFSSEVCKQSN